MSRFRKRPVVIEAIQWTGDNWDLVHAWLTKVCEIGPIAKTVARRGHHVAITTLEGEVTASPMDWIICGTAGELYPCKPDIFANVYEPV